MQTDVLRIRAEAFSERLELRVGSGGRVGGGVGTGVGSLFLLNLTYYTSMRYVSLAVAGVLGGGLQNAMIALAAISWPKYARIARSQTLAQKETAWMKAVRLSGSSTGKILLGHILPNIMGPILITSMLDIGTMMMELAALSFLGRGAKPPIPEWGSMMSDTRTLMTTSPWIPFSPGIAIFISVMIFNLLGDTVRDYADPKSRR